MSIGIIIIAILASIASSIVGVFLVLRKMSMMTDAISHTVLLGIVIGFAIVFDLNSPLLIIFASIMGVITTYLIELLIKSKRTSEDAATGIVFPLLFSIAVIIISLKFKDVHLDIDAVLLGNLEFAIFDQLIIFGKQIGPKSLYVMLLVTILNITFLLTFYKELKIVSFDPALASVLGIHPSLIHYLFMFLVSLTAVAAFNAVGSILVIAMMVGPAISSLLLTKNLSKTILVAILIGVINTLIGYFSALYFDVVISGSIATVTLVIFIIIFLINPKNGVISTIIKRRQQKADYTMVALLIHINNHIEELNKYEINDVRTQKMLDLKDSQHKDFKRALSREYLKLDNNYLKLTLKAHEMIKEHSI